MELRSKRPEAPTTAESGGRVMALRMGGAAIAPGARSALLAKLRAGGVLDEMSVDILAYVQKDGESNRNFVRFSHRALQHAAKTMIDRPLLRDHAQREVLAVGGSVTAGELIEHEGGKALRLSIDVIKPWMQEGILDGTIREFSIAWNPLKAEDPVCTVCSKSMFTWEQDGCRHFPGDVVELKSGEKKTVEMLFTDVESIETSAVVVPGVRGTRIEGIRAELSAWRGQPSKEKPMRTIATELGLQEDASEATCLEAVRAQRSARLQAETALAKVQAELAASKAAEQATQLESLVEGAYREGKIIATLNDKGERIANGVETAIRKLAALDIAGGRAFVEAMPRVVPVGGGNELQSRKNKPPEEDNDPTSLSASEKALCKRRGISEESYLASKAAVLNAGQEEAEDDDEEDAPKPKKKSARKGKE